MRSFGLYRMVDKESKKIITARILSNLVVSVSKGNSNYVSKFQLSSSNSSGDLSNFVTEIEDQKGDRFYHLFVETWLLLKLPKSKERAKQNFQS